MTASFLDALMIFLKPMAIAMLMLGGLVGTLFSAIPGLTGTLALALMLPFTYGLPADMAFILIIGMLGGTVYGGSLTAISINVPGAPSSVCTTFDGYPMFKRGDGDKAIGLATFSSIVGGIFSAILLMIAAPQLAQLALKFGPPEYFTLCIFGLTAVITLGGDHVKSVISGLFGLLLGTMGIDLFGNIRYNFGSTLLTIGMPLIPVVVGLFAISMVFKSVQESKDNMELDISLSSNFQRMKFPTWQEIKELGPVFLRSSLIGSFIGFLPGAGGNVAAFVSYNIQQKLSKHPEEFGNGSIEGLAASETANNATVGGTLIPTIALGIPGDQFTAIMLGAFIIHGLPVGPLLFRENQGLMYVIFITTLLTNLSFLVYGFFGAKHIIRLASLRKSILVPLIALFALTGIYASQSSSIVLGIGIFFGIVAFFFNRYNFPAAPAILGLTLCTLLENSLVQSLMMTSGDYFIFFKRPASLFFIVLSVLFVLSSFIDIKSLFANKKAKAK